MQASMLRLVAITPVRRLAFKVTRHLVNDSERDRLHFLGCEVADRMGQLDVRMPRHSLALELEVRCRPERLGDYGGGGDPTFFELYCVVHTAQRAGASAPKGAYHHVALLGHLLNHFQGGWF